MSVSRRRFLATSSLGLTGAMIGATKLSLAGFQVSNELIAPELIKGGGKNYSVWPSGFAEIDQPNVQWAVDHVGDGGRVRLRTRRDKTTGQPIPFEFGPEHIRIHGKSIVIVGMSRGPDMKPLIQGSSDQSGLAFVPGHEGVGVFLVDAPGCEVEFRSLEIRHVFAPTLPDWNNANPGTYGSATIANAGCAELRVIDCEVQTFATAAISNFGWPGNLPFTLRQQVVSGCRIRGHAEDIEDPYGDLLGWAGNYSSVNLGSFGSVDLKGGYFEVTDCQLDPALFAGVYSGIVDSDQYTRWLLAGNAIGYDPVAPGEQATAAGIWIGQSLPETPGGFVSSPAGTLDIIDNNVIIQRYLTEPIGLANGVNIEINYDLNLPLQASVIGNSIDLSVPRPSPEVLIVRHDGISYAGFGSQGDVVKSSAVIRGNSISSSYEPAIHGISLGENFRSLSATGVVVSDNDFPNLTVIGYPLHINSLSTGNTVNEPSLSCAEIYGDRNLNTITASGVLCS